MSRGLTSDPLWQNHQVFFCHHHSGNVQKSLFKTSSSLFSEALNCWWFMQGHQSLNVSSEVYWMIEAIPSIQQIYSSGMNLDGEYCDLPGGTSGETLNIDS